MRIPEVGCHWVDKSKDDLGSCFFQMFVTKMEDIQDEFGGSPRKQTKVETIVEGFKAVHNAQAAQKLIGMKFIVSRSGKPLNITTLPADVLKNQFTLPQEYEDHLKGTAPKANTPAVSGAFAGFGRAPTTTPLGTDLDSKRIALAAKRMFMELGASLEVCYAHEDNDLVVLQVIKDAKPESMIDALFEGGEHAEGADNYRISFGLLKEIK